MSKFSQIKCVVFRNQNLMESMGFSPDQEVLGVLYSDLEDRFMPSYMLLADLEGKNIVLSYFTRRYKDDDDPKAGTLLKNNVYATFPNTATGQAKAIEAMFAYDDHWEGDFPYLMVMEQIIAIAKEGRKIRSAKHILTMAIERLKKKYPEYKNGPLWSRADEDF